MHRTWQVPLLALALAACGDPPADSTGDATEGITGDAAHEPDGRLDAAPDVVPDAAPSRGRVTLHALTVDYFGRNAEGADVLFHDPDGTLASQAVTDSDGNAQGELLPGGSVTVHWRYGDMARFLTVVDVAPGDHLQVGLDGAPFVPTDRTPLTFDAFDGENGHSIFTQCQGYTVSPGEVSTVLQWREDCDRPRRDYVLTTSDHAHFLTLLDQPHTDQVQLPGTWASSRPTTATYTGLPDDIFGLHVWRNEHLAGVVVHEDASMGEPRSDAVIPLHALDLPGAETWIHTTLTPGHGNGRFTAAMERVPVGSDYALDATELLPLLTNATFDAKTGVVSWDAPAAAREADAVVIDVDYGITAPTRINRYTWRVIAPASVSSVRFPVVPDELEPDAPISDDASSPYAEIVVAVDDSGDTPRGLRARLDRDLETFGVVTLPRGTGRVRISRLNCVLADCDVDSYSP